MSPTNPTTGASLESLVSELADEFIERLAAGERPDVEEYARRHPALSRVLRQVLPALEALHLPSPAGPASPPPDAALPAAGCLGDYRLLREVGRGGMGVVYEAEQVSLGRRVALKVLPFAAALDDRQLQRFRIEAQAAAGLQHQHVVPVYAVGHERGVHYYAMQFIDRRALADVVAELRHQAGLPPADAPAGPEAAGTEAYPPPCAAARQPTRQAATTHRSARDPEAEGHNAGVAAGATGVATSRPEAAPQAFRAANSRHGTTRPGSPIWPARSSPRSCRSAVKWRSTGLVPIRFRRWRTAPRLRAKRARRGAVVE